MRRRGALWALVVVVLLLVAPVTIQAQEGYVDMYIAKVKPDKVAEFTVLAKKMVDANRRFNGDTWLAMETAYGEGYTYLFGSLRQNYADADKGGEAFMNALNKAYGKAAAEKMLNDWNNCLAGSRSELRRRRFDLSRKAPADAAAYAKLIGEARVLRTVTVHVRSGRAAAFEEYLKEAKEAGEKNPNTQPLLVSQAVEGNKGTVFYVTSFRSSLGGFDNNPTMREILGEEGFKKFQKVNEESVDSAEFALYRLSPALSNPPEEIAKVAADFWQAKPKVEAAAAKHKPAAVEPAKMKEPAEKPKQ